MAKYTAAAPLVIAKDESDRDIYIYEGAPVPDNVTDDSVKRLLAEGFITKSDEPDGEAKKPKSVVAPQGEPSDKWTVEQLNAYAASKSIDLGEAKNKNEILAVLVPQQ